VFPVRKSLEVIFNFYNSRCKYGIPKISYAIIFNGLKSEAARKLIGPCNSFLLSPFPFLLCTFYFVLSTLYSIRYTLYSIRYTLYPIRCTQYVISYTLEARNASLHHNPSYKLLLPIHHPHPIQPLGEV
jgi:hypothetical protein